MSLHIAISEGDGIGQEVIPEAKKILEFFLPDADFFEVELGLGKWEKTGCACSSEDIRDLKESDAILFGAVTTPPDPDYKSVLLQIRHELDLYANLRPIKSEGVDMMIVRENTEGLYSGIEEIGEERSTTLRVVTKAGSKRIAEKACSLVLERNPGRPLVIGYKGNVLKSDLLFRDTCMEVAGSYGIKTKSMFIDALCLVTFCSIRKIMMSLLQPTCLVTFSAMSAVILPADWACFQVRTLEKIMRSLSLFMEALRILRAGV